MIILYKCVEGIEKMDVNDYVISSQTTLRGHSKKLYKKWLKKDVKNHSFPDGAIDWWNTLPEEVVCVKSIIIVIIMWINDGDPLESTNA